MKIDTQEIVNQKFTTSSNVIRNPLRSLLMKIDTTSLNVIRNPLRSLLMKIGGSAARPKYPSDVEKVAVTATFSTIFNLSGHSKSFRIEAFVTSR